MTDKEIIKALECCTSESIEDCQVCPYAVDTIYCEQMKLRADALDLINRQQEQLEAAIAGQENLQKALAEETKKREVQAERLREERGQKYEQIDLLCRLRNEIAEKDKKIEQLTAEKDSLIKTFGERQAEAIKDFSKAVIDGFADGKISRVFDMVDFTADYLRGKMAGEG